MISELNRSATGTAKRTAWLARSEKSIGRRIFAMGNMTASVPDLTAAGQAKASPFQTAVARARVATIGRGSIVARRPRRLLNHGEQCADDPLGRGGAEHWPEPRGETALRRQSSRYAVCGDLERVKFIDAMRNGKEGILIKVQRRNHDLKNMLEPCAGAVWPSRNLSLDQVVDTSAQQGGLFPPDGSGRLLRWLGREFFRPQVWNRRHQFLPHGFSLNEIGRWSETAGRPFSPISGIDPTAASVWRASSSKRSVRSGLIST